MTRDEREAGLPELVPLCGCRPLDTYTGQPLYCRLADHRVILDCPCGGHVPRGSRLVCLVCHRTGWTGLLSYLLSRAPRLPRLRAYTGEAKAGKGKSKGKSKPKTKGKPKAVAA